MVENKSYPTDDNRCIYLYSELDTLVATLGLLEKAMYKESFIIIRTILEKFLYFWLMLEGRKYRLTRTFHINPKVSSASMIARDKTADLCKKEKSLGNPNYKDILNIQKSLRHDDEIVVTYEPEVLFEEHDINQTGPIIPNYNYMLEEYNPELAHTYDIVTVNEGLVSPAILSEVAKTQKQIYHNYFYIDNIIRNLEICSLIDDFKSGILRVYYNFLSKFVHPTIESINLWKNHHELNGKYREEVFIELIILYISSSCNCFLIHSWNTIGRIQI